MFFPSSIVHSDQPHDITDFLVRTTTDLGCPLTPTNPDILIINQNHSIEQVRQISHFFGQKPILHSCQIVIIHQTDLFTAEAQNALLKTLEEPKANAYLFLITSRPSRLLITIRSRCHLVKLNSSPDSSTSQPSLPPSFSPPAQALEFSTQIQTKIAPADYLNQVLRLLPSQLATDQSPHLAARLQLTLTALDMIDRRLQPGAALDYFCLGY